MHAPAPSEYGAGALWRNRADAYADDIGWWGVVAVMVALAPALMAQTTSPAAPLITGTFNAEFTVSSGEAAVLVGGQYVPRGTDAAPSSFRR